jgi:hypothetical protein
MSTKIIETDRYKYISAGIILLLTVFLRLPILMEPWGGDQAGFGHVAKGMLEGKVPYKDMYSLTAYGVFFTFSLFFKLFGVNMVAPHIGHLLVSLLSVILIFYLTHYLYGVKTALITAFFYTLFSNGLALSGFGYENKSAWGTYWYLSQREVFMAPLIMGAVFLAIFAENKKAFFIYFVSGILIGLAAFYKLTAILVLVLFIIFIAMDELIYAQYSSFKKAIMRISCLLLGFILVQLPFLYYFWIHDALKDMYQALFVHLSAYTKLSRGLRIETFFSGHYSIMSENLVLWLFSFISCLHIIFKNRNRNNMFIVLWCLCSLFMVWGQGKFFGYHFILLIPPFAVLTGYGLPIFIKNGQGLKSFFQYNLKDIKTTFMLATLLLTVGAFAISNYEYYKIHALYFLGKKSKEEYYRSFNEFPTHPYSFRTDYQIAQYLIKNGSNDEKLGVIFSAGDTIIHFLTGMEPATRFIQSWYLFSSDENLSNDKITINLRNEFIDQLITSEPRYILCVHIPLNDFIQTPSLKKDSNVKRLNDFVHSNYHLKVFPDNRFLYIRL